MSALAQDLTSADLDDLVERMRAAGQDGAEGEELKAAMGRLDELPPVQAAGLVRQAVVAALRYGGRVLAWLLRHFNQEVAGYVLRHSQVLADFLDRAENWAVAKIAQFLERLGVPGHHAAEIARVLMAIVG
ncbi:MULTISPECIES: hypothetical protein [Streptomyces]|uniref:Uncharacterized protein n=1 Tax=Streptomyces levis TaxID=285566 RepID=A0ABP6B1J4_9ACTN